MAIEMTLEQYEALSWYAREGTTGDQRRAISTFLRGIEEANSITRHFLWVFWQEAGSALPPTAEFPSNWPPEYSLSIERLDRPVAKADVEEALSTRANKPVNIMVTTDPGAALGWQELDSYFKG